MQINVPSFQTGVKLVDFCAFTSGKLVQDIGLKMNDMENIYVTEKRFE